MPYTCTSTHPVKALWFALDCYHQNPAGAGVYVAQMELLKNISHGYNHLRQLENEVGFFIQPVSFYKLCDGFIHVADFQSILKQIDIDGYHIVRKENLSKMCKSTSPMPARVVESLVAQMQPYLKK